MTTEDEHGLYVLAGGDDIHDFYLVKDDAVGRKDELEEQYPPEELDLTVYQVAELEKIE